MIEQNIRQKINYLIERGKQLGDDEVRDDDWMPVAKTWNVEVLNIVHLALPSPENRYRQFIEAVHGDVRANVRTRCELLGALLRDIDAGLIGDLANRVRAETFDNFLDHAVAYQKDGRKNEAGVIAGVVFEDTIRSIHRDKLGADIDIHLEVLINALTKAEILTGQESKQAKVGAHVRTKASHARWDEFDEAGVDATIQIVRQLMAKHMGG